MVVQTGSVASLQGGRSGDIQNELLAGIARCAEDLTNGRGWPDGVHGLLETLGRITGVSRVWIFQTIELTDDYIIQDYTFEWASEPKYEQITMPSFSMFRTAIDNEDYRDIVESRKRGEWQKVLTSTLTSPTLRDAQIRQGILSMLTIPILAEDQWWGILGFDDCEREYDWTDTEISLLRTATFLISNAVIRDRLSAVRKQFDILQSITESSAWEYNLKKARFWCTPELINRLPGASNNLRLSLRRALGLVHHDERRGLIDAVIDFIESNEKTFRRDLRVYSQCGEVLWIEVIGTMERDADGRPEQIAGIAVDILKRKEREEKLKLQASTDYLTGAVNREMFEGKLRSELVSAMEKSVPLSLIMLDIDHFKVVNDTWGHDVGDMVLREFTSVCGSSLRSSDVLARIGGEEFAILLPEADERTAVVIGERIREAVERTMFEGPEKGITVTTSVGCSTFEGSVPLTPEILFKAADHALYTAKRNGRNQLVAHLPFATDCAL